MTESVSGNAFLVTYRNRLSEIAERGSQAWDEPGADPMRVAAALQRALVSEANAELRQILAQTGAQLELTLLRANRDGRDADATRLEGLVRAVERASAIVETYLNPDAPTELTIRLDTDVFDLGGRLDEMFLLNGFANDPDILVHLESAVVRGDSEKLVDVLVHLVSRFRLAARPRERLVVQLKQASGRVECFVGLAPSHIDSEDLVTELCLPLDVESMEIDLAYARTVIERHGGEIFVATADEGALGFSISLPLAEDA